MGAPLDIDPSRARRAPATSARASACRPRATASWRGARATSVYARRVTGLNPSSFPQELSVARHRRRRRAAAADSPDIDVEDDGSFAWATFRQDIAGGSRALARRMLGSTFDPPVPLDAGPGSTAPRVAMNGRGQGLATFETPGGGVAGNVLYNDVFAPGQLLHSAASTQGAEPKPGASEHRESVVAWRVADGGGNAAVKGRIQPEPTKPFDPEVELSRPDLGAVPGRAVRGRGRPPGGLRGGDGPGAAHQPRDHRRAARPPAGPPGRDRAQRVAERPAREARVAPGPRPVGAAALPRRRRRQGRRRDDRQLAACRPSA